MTNKNRVFIGSSSENLVWAELAKNILNEQFDVTIWNESIWDKSIFKINQNFLSDLLKASLQYDFGLLLGSSDDKVVYRQTELLQPRDNVLFELGLFMGRMGLSNCAFVVEENLKILSDLQGINLAQYKKNDTVSFKEAIEKVNQLFLAQANQVNVNFFPSSTLASVYFENLITPLCRYLIENDGYEIDDEKYAKYIIDVIVPLELNTDVNIQFEKLKKDYDTKNTTFKYSGRHRHINVDTKIIDEVLVFIDFPTVITGIDYAIRNLLPNDYNDMSSDYKTILSRELERFIITLSTLAQRAGFHDMIKVKRV